MIDKYLISNSLIVIQEFNDRFSHLSNEQLKEFSDKEFSESDLVFLVAFPFKHLARFSTLGSGRDIYIKPLDFCIEAKYLRNTKSTNGHYSNTITWKNAFQKDFEWLCEEIKRGNKGKRAFILGWFNVVDSFSQIMQLGKGGSNGKSGGGLPDVNDEKLRLFPFLNLDGDKIKTKDIKYMYSKAYDNHSITVKGLFTNTVNCIFLGKESDKFHFAIYF